jgi:outer membrane protein assembly factor BamD
MLEKGYEYYEKGDNLKAKTLFDLILNDVRGTADAEKLFFTYADVHFKMGQYILAAYYFDNFAQTYAYSEYREDAEYYSAYSNYLLSPTYRLDQQNTVDAINGFQNFIDRYPASEKVEECEEIMKDLRKKLEVKAFESAKLYFDLRNYQAALHALENVLQEYPDIDNTEEIRYLIVKSAFLLAENSIYEKQRERYALTIRKYREFRKKFPDSKYDKEIETIREKAEEKLNTLKYV